MAMEAVGRGKWLVGAPQVRDWWEKNFLTRFFIMNHVIVLPVESKFRKGNIKILAVNIKTNLLHVPMACDYEYQSKIEFKNPKMFLVKAL